MIHNSIHVDIAFYLDYKFFSLITGRTSNILQICSVQGKRIFHICPTNLCNQQGGLRSNIQYSSNRCSVQVKRIFNICPTNS